MSDANERTYRIVVLGAGVIGLTTACTILKEYSTNENLQLTIISEEFSPNTTGDVSAGCWQPYGFAKMDEKILKWAGYTHDIFLKEYFSTKAARAGIMKVPSYILQGYNGQNTTDDNHIEEQPVYVSLLRHFRLLDKNEIQIFDHLKPVSGFVMSTVAVEVRKYLSELQRYLEQDKRVKFFQKKIHSINELKDQADLVINCTGLASRSLVGDETIRPARGQVLRVKAPWIKAIYEFNTDEGFAYIIPQADCVVLGGTFQLNDWNTTPDENDTKRILRSCAKCLPALEQVKDYQAQVGLRPYRDDGVRLEHEKTSDGIDVIHCYGHSGSGVTLSWGCAKDVVELVKRFLTPNQQQNDNHLPEH